MSLVGVYSESSVGGSGKSYVLNLMDTPGVQAMFRSELWGWGVWWCHGRLQRQEHLV